MPKPDETPARVDTPAPTESSRPLRIVGVVALVVVLFGILIASLWFMMRIWASTPGVAMNVHGYVAMTLGVVFSLVVGCGLMVLVFYSSRHGYDEASYHAQNLSQQYEEETDGAPKRTGENHQ